MNYTIERRDGFVVFALKNTNLDSNVSAQFKAEILIVAQPNIKALILDITAVEYVDSSGLGAMLLAQRQLDNNSIPVVLVGVQEAVERMLSISHLTDVFKYYDTIEATISDLK